MNTTEKIRNRLNCLRLEMLKNEMDGMHIRAEIRKAERQLQQLETARE